MCLDLAEGEVKIWFSGSLYSNENASVSNAWFKIVFLRYPEPVTGHKVQNELTN